MSNPRPLSPHLQVYKPQLTSMLSIIHRLTGAALAVGALAFAYWIFALAQGSDMYADFMTHATSWYGQVMLFGWTFSFFYHFCNGIRHLFWDAGYGFELPAVYKSGWAVVIASLIFTGLTWAFACVVMGDFS